MIELQPGSVSKEQAKTNRENVEIELAVTKIAVLPQGLIVFDRAPQLPSGSRMVGAGIDNTIIQNGFDTSSFPNNTSLQVNNPAGVGYVDSFQPIKGGIELLTGDPANYPAGGWLFTWKWNSFSPATVRRHQIVAKNKGDGRKLKLSLDPDPSSNAACYFTPRRTDDKWWRRTDGPTLANEIAGEFRASSRPYRKEYKYPIDIGVQMTENVRIENLTIGAPVTANNQGFFAKWVAGLSMYRVRIANGVQLGNCTNVSMIECQTPSLSLNGIEDSMFRDLVANDCYMEEGCIDLDFRDIRLINSPTNGFHSNTGCERIRVDGFRIENCRGMPISVLGREHRFTNGVIASDTDVLSYITGDRNQMANIVSNRQISMSGGKNILASNVVCPAFFLGWPGRPATGMVSNVVNLHLEYQHG